MNGSLRDLKRRQAREQRLQLKAWRWAGRALAAILASGIIGTLCITAVSTTSSVADGHIVINVTANDLDVISSSPLSRNQSIGKHAHLTLKLEGSMIDVADPSTQSMPAHNHVGLGLDAECSLSMTNLLGGSIIAISLTQVFVFDEVAPIAVVTEPAVASAYTANFWQIEQAAQPQTFSLPNNGGVTTTLTVAVARFGKTAMPLESYEVTLALMMSMDGKVECAVYVPTTGYSPPPSPSSNASSTTDTAK